MADEVKGRTACRALPDAAVTSSPSHWYSRGSAAAAAGPAVAAALSAATTQGLTLLHFSAQLERFVWDRGCA